VQYSPWERLKVTIQSIVGTTEVDLDLYNFPGPYQFLAAIETAISGQTDLSGTSPAYAVLGASVATDGNGPEDPGQNSHKSTEKLSAQTPIWTVAPDLSLTATYVNFDDTKAPLQFAYNSTDGSLALTGNFTLFNAAYGGGKSENITFTLVPVPV